MCYNVSVFVPSIHGWFITASGSSHVAHRQNSQWPHPPVDNQRKSAQEEYEQYFFFFFLVFHTMKAAAPVTPTDLIISALQAV